MDTNQALSDHAAFRADFSGVADDLRQVLTNVRATKVNLAAAKEILDVPGEVEEVAETVRDLADDLQTGLKLVTKLGGILGGALKTATKVVEDALALIENRAEGVREAAEDINDEIGDIVTVLGTAIDTAVTAIETFWETEVETAVAAVERLEAGIIRLDDALPSFAEVFSIDGPDERLETAIHAAGEAARQHIAELAEVEADELVLGAELAEILSTRTPQLELAISLLVDADKKLGAIDDSVGFLAGPLDVIAKVIGPIEPLLDAISFVFDVVARPIIDPILKATGINLVLENFGARLEALAPRLNGMDKFDAALQALTDFGFVPDEPSDRLEQNLLAPVRDTALDAEENEGEGRLVFFDGTNNVETTESAPFELGDGNDILVDDLSDNAVDGGAGEDVFVMAGGDDTIRGGADRDVAFFDGSINDYAFTVREDGDVTVYHPYAKDGDSYRGVNTFGSVERFAFRDLQLDDTDLDNLIRLDNGNTDFDGSDSEDPLFVLGSAGSNEILGGSANDFLTNGGNGNDTIDGGGGDDTVQFVRALRSSASELSGGDGTDTLLLAGSSIGFTVNLSGTNQTINVFQTSIDGFENVIGTIQDDDLTGSSVDNALLGGNGDDFLDGQDGDDTMIGGAGNDFIRTGNGNDVGIGLDGDDTISVTDGGTADNLDGGIGRDLLQLTNGVVTVDLGAGETTYGNGEVSITKNFENVETSSGDDVVFTDARTTNVVDTGDGDDEVFMRGSGDAEDRDLVRTGSGSDTVHFGGNNGGRVFTQEGNDLARFDASTPVNGATGQFILNGGAGESDRLNLVESTIGVDLNGLPQNTIRTTQVRSDDGSVSELVFRSFEEYVLTENDDRLEGSIDAGFVDMAGGNDFANFTSLSVSRPDGTQVYRGGEGNDRMLVEALDGAGVEFHGDAGDDVIFATRNSGSTDSFTIDGGDGDDHVYASSDGERLFGGDGNDIVDFTFLHNPVEVDLSAGTARTEVTTDQLDGFETVIGSAGADTITGSDAADDLQGGLGSDVLNGGAGDDTLRGGSDAAPIAWRHFNGGDSETFNGNGMAIADHILTSRRKLNDFGTTEELDVAALDAQSGGNGQTFVLAMTTSITIAEPGTYRFRQSSDDGFVMYIDGEQVIVDNQQSGAGFERPDFHFLETGTHVVTMGFFQAEGRQSLDVEILGPDTGGQFLDLGAFVGTPIDTLNGGDGDDLIVLDGSGVVVADGGEGRDTLDLSSAESGRVVSMNNSVSDGGTEVASFSNVETVIGTRFDDQLIGSNDGDTLYGDAGDDFVRGRQGNDVLNGGDGDDTVVGNVGSDTLAGGAGNDVLNGGSGDDYLQGGPGQDTMTGGRGADLFAFTDLAEGDRSVINDFDLGSDKIYFVHPLDENGDPVILIDEASFDSNGDGVIDASDDGWSQRDGNLVFTFPGGGSLVLEGLTSLGLGHFDFGDPPGEAPVPFEQAETGGAGPDLLIGLPTHDRLTGGGGDDTINGAGGQDIVEGGAGDDDLSGGDDDDRVVGGDGNDRLDGGAGDDGLLSQAGDDTILGGEGDDNIAGSSGNDAISGDAGRDNIGGGIGNDLIEGGDDADTIGGGDGDDTIDGQDGDDVVAGGAGDDALSGGAGSDTMGGSFGDDVVRGGDGDDSLGGGAGSDTLWGEAGADSIGGGFGADDIRGGGGDDFLAGGGGDDTILGGAGDDRLNAGRGNDLMRGDAGADTFVFTEFTAGETDRILAFEDGADTLFMVGVDGAGLQGRVDALNVTDMAGGVGVTLTYEGHVIEVMGVTSAEIGVEDFQFL